MEEVKRDLKKLIDISHDISFNVAEAASQASYVDTNTENLNKKLDIIIELLEEIAK